MQLTYLKNDGAAKNKKQIHESALMAIYLDVYLFPQLLVTVGHLSRTNRCMAWKCIVLT